MLALLNSIAGINHGAKSDADNLRDALCRISSRQRSLWARQRRSALTAVWTALKGEPVNAPNRIRVRERLRAIVPQLPFLGAHGRHSPADSHLFRFISALEKLS